MLMSRAIPKSRYPRRREKRSGSRSKSYRLALYFIEYLIVDSGSPILTLEGHLVESLPTSSVRMPGHVGSSP